MGETSANGKRVAGTHLAVDREIASYGQGKFIALGARYRCKEKQ
jgi:hypothetical protein